MIKKSNEAKILNDVFERKVITINELSSMLNSSVETARRRLKLWDAYTSYNKNGRFYTLPTIPEFDKNGLWVYQSIRFSKYGNLKQTIIKQIKLSKAGYDASELSDLLGIPVRSFLSYMKTNKDIKREKIQGRFIYFSEVEDEFLKQKNFRNNMTRIIRLPKDTDAILILAEKIKNPLMNFEALSLLLREKKCFVTPESIRNLFEYHGLTEKKNAEISFLNCLCYYQDKVHFKISIPALFKKAPVFDFFPEEEFCLKDKMLLKVLKREVNRTKITMKIGKFTVRETIKVCPECGTIYRSKELLRIAPPSCNFGYDVLVYVGKAIFICNLPDKAIVEELAVRNVHISLSEISWLGRKFIAYLTLAHRKSAPRIKNEMNSKGGYILHLDGTYEENSPLLMIGLDSIMKIVIGNCKMLSEKSDDIIPFLEDIKQLFGDPLAVIHDMSKGISKAVGIVFKGSLDFICHFHFLRDIGKDILEPEYDNIRKRLKKQGITRKMNYRMRQFKQVVEENMKLIDLLNDNESTCCEDLLQNIPMFSAYSLMQWAFEGQKKGNGYGFPFDRPHFEFAKRLKEIHADIDELRKIRLLRDHKYNNALHKTFFDLSDVINDTPLWKSVDRIEAEIEIFEKLRDAMRIAPKTGKEGLNSEGSSANIKTIEQGVKKFRKEIVSRKGYTENKQHRKMVKQLDKYWEKLFTDPIEVQTDNGKKIIQPQRTNNYAEQSFRDFKRGFRKKTGNGSLGKKLRTMMANTPLVKNLQNPEYMKILLNGHSSLEDLFAEIDANEVRNELKKSQENVDKLPANLKKLIKKSDFPKMLKDYYFGLKSNSL